MRARFERERGELNAENLRLREQARGMVIKLDTLHARVAELENQRGRLLRLCDGYDVVDAGTIRGILGAARADL